MNEYVLTLESHRFPVLGEVSFCIRTLLMAKETEQGVTFTYKFVTAYMFNCHSTIALKNS